MDCKSALLLLHAYLDGELGASEVRELELHVDDCAGCREALSQLDALRSALRDPSLCDLSLRYQAPASLRERIRAAARTIELAPTTPLRAPIAATPWWRLVAASALAFAAGAVTVSIWTPGPARHLEQAQLERDLFASHWRALAAASPVDVVSSDRHTVKPWFAGRIADAPPAVDFATQGFALVGGRLDYVGTERVAVLVYGHGHHLIDVFVLPSVDSASLTTSVRQRGYSLDRVSLGGQDAVIASDMDAAERARFAQLLGTVP